MSELTDIVDQRIAQTAERREPSQLEWLDRAIRHSAHLLPAQGPITAFVHHNTLHAFENMPFDSAVMNGARVFGCEPYLSEEKYRELFSDDRIQADDLVAVLLQDLDEQCDTLIGRFGTRLHLRLTMLQYPLRTASRAELRWLVAESEALKKFRPETSAAVRRKMIDETRHWVMRDLCGDAPASRGGAGRGHEIVAALADQFNRDPIECWEDATCESFSLHLLWQICRDGAQRIPDAAPPATASVRHRDLLMRTTGEDSDQLINEFLIKLCAAFLDQGVANWLLPQRDAGFYRAFLGLYAAPAGAPDLWLRGLTAEVKRLSKAGTTPIESIEESLHDLGVEPEETERFVAETLLALRGWGGMIWQMETRGDRAAHPAPHGSLVEFLAIRLLLERFALKYLARESLAFRGPLSELRKAAAARAALNTRTSVEQRAFFVFQLAQVLDWRPQYLYELSDQEWTQLIHEIEEFSSLQRRRIYHAAYERRFNVGLLDAVAVHTTRTRSRADTPRFQVACCIDDREESFRRHLEEVAPDCETFGYAGFYGVEMYYRGVADAHFLPLCPVIVKPNHYVQEDVDYTLGGMHRRRSETRRALGTASHHWHVGSRSFLGGIFTALLGALASIPMVTRILFPRSTAQIRWLFGRVVQPPQVTSLKLERQSPEPGSEDSQIGYSLAEMVELVERGLRDIGLTSDFARLIFITGHGSSSMNNPHESAYNCGACAGGRGGPNARAFAQMANDPRVRHRLADKGLSIPDTTVYVSAYHDTCNDRVTFYDLDWLPSSHWRDFEDAKDCIDQARQRNAHERCRRFESTDLVLSPDQALRHVEARAENLAEAATQYHVVAGRDGGGRQRPATGSFQADGGNPRAAQAGVHYRDVSRSDATSDGGQ